jgi:hypothetical protein
MRAFLLAVVGAIFFPVVLVGQDSAKNSAAGRQGKPADRAPALQINRSGLAALIDSLEKDSSGKQLTVRLTGDSVGALEAAGKSDSNRYSKLLDNPLLPMGSPPRDGLIAFRERAGKDLLFYLVTGILLLLAVIRIGFPSYFSRLFQYFFQTSMRQRQTRDRLLQEQLAAVGLNLLFFMVMGTFVTLLAFWRGWYVGSFWMLWSASTGFLSLIYGGKYIFLQLTGWVFNSGEAMRSYIFVVYLVNKIMAVLFLPLLILVAFSAPPIVESSLTIGLLLVGAAFVYRYAVSFPLIRNKMALNAFHFFLYFISLEVIPLLVILKLLFRKLNVFV